MAYTIELQQGDSAKRDRILAYLQARISKEGIFRATLTPFSKNEKPSIRVRPVRLVKAKPYCGSHPGECVVNSFLGPSKKPNAHYLEWDDWVKFHNLVNRILNKFRANANVWSMPQGKMWIRKGINPRVRWEYTEEYNSFGQPIRIWNTGTVDQFGLPFQSQR